MNYWQIASGSLGREYSPVFLKYGIAAVGGESQIARMRQAKPGDRVVLKRGRQEILAVGEVVERDGRYAGSGDKDWLRDFDGWDLAAYCLVDWHRPPEPVQAAGLTRSTIDQVHKEDLKAAAEQVLREAARLPVVPEPDAVAAVADGELLEYLVQEGLSPRTAESLAGALGRIRLLADYYYRARDFRWEDILEHETRTFLIIPLLLSLGWSEQQLKIEWGCRNGRIDIACFSKRFRRVGEDGEAGVNLNDVSLIIESKGFATGLDYAPAQALAYAEEFPSCQTFVVSNGYCYKAYRRDVEGRFSRQPFAYLNLVRPTRRYPLDPVNVAGGLEVLKLLLPNGGSS